MFMDDAAAPQLPGVPSLAKNREGDTGVISTESIVREAVRFHTIGLRNRRRRDLTAEKYALHIDGEGMSQWLDIFDGHRLRMPIDFRRGPKQQNNQLRPIVDNMVAHLTTKPYQVVAHATADRRSRQASRIDSALINHLIRANHWNALWAQAKFVAAAYGSCPLHAFWREDEWDDEYEAVPGIIDINTGMPIQGVRPGRIDNVLGNPWATVYDGGATRTRRHRQTFERTLPTVLVRQAFQRPDLEGTDKLSAASFFHRIGQRWESSSQGQHGFSFLSSGESNAELSTLLYDEIAPGIVPEYPNGRLAIYHLQGRQDDVAKRENVSNADLLWIGELPAGTFSSIIVQSHHGRMDDIHGKPFVADLDDDQIELNQLETLYAAWIKRASDPPLVTSGHVDVGTIDYSGATLLEIEPGTQGAELTYLTPDGQHIPVVGEKIARVLEGMYRKGGWMAASRGESGGSGKAIIALQTADDSVFGPLSQQTKMEVEEFSQLNWKLFDAFGDVPLTIDLVGDELAHLVEPKIDRTMLSERAPTFQKVSGFGVSPEAEAQQLLNLLNVRDYKGEGVLTAADVKRKWPDQNLFDDAEDPEEVRKRRPRVINRLIENIAEQMLQQYPAPNQMSHPQAAAVGQQVALLVDQREKAMMDDDLEAHIDALTLLTQDTTEHAVVRLAAQMRQQQYFQWAAQRQAAMMGQPAQQQPQAPGQAQRVVGGPKQGTPGALPRPDNNTSTAEAMVQRDREAARVQPGERTA